MRYIHDHRPGAPLRDHPRTAARLDRLGPEPLDTLLANPLAPPRQRGGIGREAVLKERLATEVPVVRVSTRRATTAWSDSRYVCAGRASPPPATVTSPGARYATGRTRPPALRRTPSRSELPASPARGACRSCRSGADPRGHPVRSRGIWASSLDPKLQGSGPKPTKSCSYATSKNAVQDTKSMR